LYNAGFYEAIKGLLQTLLDNNPDFFSVDNMPDNEGVFLFMEKLIFEILAMTTENKHLIDIVKQYMSMLQKNSYQAFQLIERRILMLDKPAKE
jgi:hypothetical protein